MGKFLEAHNFLAILFFTQFKLYCLIIHVEYPLLEMFGIRSISEGCHGGWTIYSVVRCVCERQRTFCRSRFSSFTMWVLEIKLRSSLVASTFNSWAISQTWMDLGISTQTSLLNIPNLKVKNQKWKLSGFQSTDFGMAIFNMGSKWMHRLGIKNSIFKQIIRIYLKQKLISSEGCSIF